MRLDIVLIRKKIFLFGTLLILFFFTSSLSLKASNQINTCNEFDFDKSLNNLKKLQIKFENYKSWSINGLRILKFEENTKIIPEKFKKRFSASLIAYNRVNQKCNYKARIRQSGNKFDHIEFKNGNIIQSLDVVLEDGNIFGVKKFKLYIPSTRNGNSEIIISHLLNKLGYLSPRTFFLDINLNGKTSNFLFSEKTTKELIENFAFKEAPLYEGNENLVIGTSKDKNVMYNKKLTFAKQINTNWINSKKNREIAVDGLTKLNNVYFKNISYFKKKNHKVDQLTLDYKLLSNNNEDHFDYLVIYDAFINSVNGGHALLPHNRKFYYDPSSKMFYPIFYDGSPGSVHRSLLGGWSIKIKKLQENQFKWGISKNAIIGAEPAIKKIESIDMRTSFNTLKEYGVNYTFEEFLNVINAMKHNLKVISKINYNKDTEFDVDLEDYIKFAKNNTSEFNIFYSNKKNNFVCLMDLNDCSPINLNEKNFKTLINGELKYQGNKSLYLGNLINKNKKKIFNIR